MPSSYSSRIRLELQATGENNATWGTKANTDFSLVDEAIAGVSSVSMSDANTTLTASNAISDQSRPPILILTGTLTASRNVVVPTTSKLYFVYNNTTGGYSVVVKTSSGTGITIPNGKKRLVYSDGTNVVDGISDLPASATVNNSAILLNSALDTDGTLAANDDTKIATQKATKTYADGKPPIGSVIDFAGSSAPSMWALCYGQAISRSTYSALYAIIGTTYGVGDGSTTFNLPDCRGRVTAGKDNMGGSAASRLTNSGTGNPGINGTTLGAAGGSQSHTLTTAELAAHSHGLTDNGHSHTKTDTGHTHAGSSVASHDHSYQAPGSGFGVPNGADNIAIGLGGSTSTGAAAPAVTVASATTGISYAAATTGITMANAGSGDAHAIVQPTIVFNKIIYTGVA